MNEPTKMPEWLERQFNAAERTVDSWSDGKREAAGIPSSSNSTRLQYIVCPHCYHRDDDDKYLGEGEHDLCCDRCGKEYVCSVTITLSYATYKKNDRN